MSDEPDDLTSKILEAAANPLPEKFTGDELMAHILSLMPLIVPDEATKEAVIEARKELQR